MKPTLCPQPLSHFTILSVIAGAIALALSAPTSALAIGLKPQPSGIYDLLVGAPITGMVDLTNNPLLDNPNVDGYRFKSGWARIQPDGPDTYNWDQIDAAIAIAAAHGKKLSISIGAGIVTPDWVYNTPPLVYKYPIIETDPATGLSIGNEPLPWDTAYQAKWATFLAAYAARYDKNPNCSYIVMGGFMQVITMTLAGISADETALTALAQNPPAGYPGLTTSYTDANAAYIPAAEAIITQYTNTFSETSVIATLARVFPSAAGLADQQTVSNWALLAFPNHFGTMVSALYATAPPHAPAPVPPLASAKGFQMVCHASDASRLYIDPDPVPLPSAPTPLQDALEHAVSLGGKYVEVYEDDLTPTASQSALTTEQAKLKANVPAGGPPQSPTNLRLTP